jgi:hypothetical protein
MTATQAVAAAVAAGLRLRVEGDRIRFAPVSRMTPALRSMLAEHKAEILDLLRRDPANQISPLIKPRPATTPASVGKNDNRRSPSHRATRTVYWRREQVLTLVATVRAQLGGKKSHAEALNLSLAWLEYQGQIVVGQA